MCSVQRRIWSLGWSSWAISGKQADPSPWFDTPRQVVIEINRHNLALHRTTRGTNHTTVQPLYRCYVLEWGGWGLNMVNMDCPEDALAVECMFWRGLPCPVAPAVAHICRRGADVQRCCSCSCSTLHQTVRKRCTVKLYSVPGTWPTADSMAADPGQD